MKARRMGWLALVVGVAGGLGLYFYPRTSVEPVVSQAPLAGALQLPAAIPPGPPPIRYPIEAVAGAETPPQGDAAGGLDPDQQARLALARADPLAKLGPVLVLESLVRRIVVTVDNLPGEKIAWRLSPLKPVGGPFLVERQGDAARISPANASRYEAYVSLAEAMDLKLLVAGYRRLYPLFQQAYRELGYPDGYFNDRLVAVIDHLLVAPEPVGPLELRQPKVLYQFANPELEALSAGQKIMVRLGVANQQRVKARLGVLRGLLVGDGRKE